MNITHLSEFRNLKFIHVIDTYSTFIFATLQTGEVTKMSFLIYLQHFLCLDVLNKLRWIMGLDTLVLPFLDFIDSLIFHMLQGSLITPRDKE